MTLYEMVKLVGHLRSKARDDGDEDPMWRPIRVVTQRGTEFAVLTVELTQALEIMLTVGDVS